MAGVPWVGGAFQGLGGGEGWWSCSCYSKEVLGFSSIPPFFLWSDLIDVSGQCHIQGAKFN